ncbi:MAG TPA: transglutaminase-like domain-containing protein [Candidatus Nanoarchaeia archaeon]|nr:transglutaminase-like domain-containing protein [Candidatus Nanoarchaeia archaeon]
MRNKIFYLIFVIFLSVNSYAAVENYNDIESLWIDINIDSSIKVTQNDDEFIFDHLNTELTLLPVTDSRQKVQSLQIISEPEASIEQKNYILYKWNEFNNEYIFGLKGSIQTFNKIYEIPNAKFPILSVDKSLRQYLEPTDNIDINDEIITKASSLAQDKNNLFEVTFTVADWVKANIEYDLNTLTATAVQKSSWVLDNRQGVCDEITSLFISMLRSIGVPARFVSGMVYTNLDYTFGNHGWAEVYFEGYGWVPFDVTFGQYGWIDPSHVKLSDSVDSATYSAKYKWRSSGLEVEPQSLVLDSKVKSVGTKLQSPYNIEASLIEDQVGEGSYVPLKVTVENPFDYYASTSVIVTKAPQVIEKNVKQVLLRPKSRGDVFWIIKVPDNLDSNYLYTADIEVKDSFGGKSSISLDYSSSYNKITEKKAKDIIDDYTNIKEVTYSQYISIKCSPDKNYYFSYETASISCTIKNKTNDLLSNINLCMQKQCKIVNVRGQQNLDVVFELALNEFSTQTIVVDAEVNNKHVNDFLSLRVYQKPGLKIDDVEYPKRVDYNDEFDFIFHVSSQTTINNIEINVNGNGYSSINSLKETQRIILPLKGSFTAYEPIKLNIKYFDENGKEYTSKEEYEIFVSNVPWYAKLMYSLKMLFT